ncbi:hypothetical protein [Nostoc sp. C117]
MIQPHSNQGVTCFSGCDRTFQAKLYSIKRSLDQFVFLAPASPIKLR